MTTNKLIQLALKQLGVLAVGEVPTADDLVDGLDTLNNLLAQWQTQKLFVYQAINQTITLDGTPAHLPFVNLHDVGKLDGQPVKLVRDTNIRPDEIAYRVDGDGIVIDTNRRGKLAVVGYALPDELGVDDELSLPKYYKRALILSLAIDLAPMYGVVVTAELARNQAGAVIMVKRANSTPIYAKNDLPVGLGRGCGCGGLFG